MSKQAPLTIGVQETARLLGLSKNSTYEGIRTGEIKSIKIGSRYLVPRAWLEERLGQKLPAKVA